MYKDLKVFKFWCQKVLPLVYDNSLSYYEVLCKVVDYINHLIEDGMLLAEQVAELQGELTQVQNWIDNFDTTFIKEQVERYLFEHVKAVVFGLSDAGYFMAVYPQSWHDIEFGTIQNGELYGHLTLSFD